MYRGRPLWNCPWNRAIQLGLGKGLIGIVGSMSQFRWNHRSRVTRADMYSHTIVCFPYQIYSGQLRVIRILIFRGAVSHRARILCLPLACPATINVMSRHRKANARDSFCTLDIAGVRSNTVCRKQLLKNILQARQAARVQFPIYPNINIYGVRVSVSYTHLTLPTTPYV